jgi:hypothetical protein
MKRKGLMFLLVVILSTALMSCTAVKRAIYLGEERSVPDMTDVVRGENKKFFVRDGLYFVDISYEKHEIIEKFSFPGGKDDVIIKITMSGALFPTDKDTEWFRRFDLETTGCTGGEESLIWCSAKKMTLGDFIKLRAGDIIVDEFDLTFADDTLEQALENKRVIVEKVKDSLKIRLPLLGIGILNFEKFDEPDEEEK